MKRNIGYNFLILLLMPLLVPAQNFTPVWDSPYNPMTFYVMGAQVNATDLLPGDEIGIFDSDPASGDLICVGAATLNEILGGGNYLEMIASMDDGSNPGQANGFTPGHMFVFRMHSAALGLITEVEFTFPYPGYDEVFAAQGSTIVELQGSPIVVDPFDPVWDSPYNPMTFYITGAQIDDVDLMAGDQIGIFDTDPGSGLEICVGAATVSAAITPENYLEVIASMDDGSNPDQANGFTPGHPFIFRMISQDVLLVEQVSYSFPYAGYDEVFTAQGSTITELAGSTTPPDQHIVSLAEGWTGISSYLIPESTTMEQMLAQISGQCMMVQDLEDYYLPETGSGGLSTWNYQSGFFIRMSVASQLVVNGFMPSGKTVNLVAGWNLIPVLSDVPVNVQDIFAEHIGQLVIVKEAIGLDVFWPGKSIFALQMLQPGKAYLVKTSEAFTVSF